jgi:hypothetical protein
VRKRWLLFEDENKRSYSRISGKDQLAELTYVHKHCIIMAMNKYLFLDDLRIPSEVTWTLLPTNIEWEIVRSYNEAVEWVLRNGWPNFVSFDHDLGDIEDGKIEKTGYDFAKWLIEYDLDGNKMPDNFSFVVHSQNHIGSKRISAIFENYMNSQRD